MMLRVIRGHFQQKNSSFFPVFTQKSVLAFQFASLMEKLEKRQRNTASGEFKKEIDFMASKNTFTLIDFRQRVLDGLEKLQKGFRFKLITGNEQTEASLVLQRKIMSAMHEEELLNPDLLDSEKKREIALISQCSMSDLNSLLKQFYNMKDIQMWLKTKKENNEPLPESQEELTWLFQKERPVSKSFKRNHMKTPTLSKKMRNQMQKWGYGQVLGSDKP